MASITPNPKKRGYLLPHGCKDLIDVLQKGDRQKIDDLIAEHQTTGLTRGGAATDKLSEIERYLKMVFESRGLMFTLAISPPDELLTVDVRQASGTVRASVVVQMGTDRETAVRDFFVGHGLTTPADSAMPEQFHPGLPVHRSYDISPLPTDSARLARLLAEFFRQLCGLADDSDMNFRYEEITNAT
jgi:hypothetical protein